MAWHAELRRAPGASNYPGIDAACLAARTFIAPAMKALFTQPRSRRMNSA
ncbi:MAG: hypothetical protein LBQ12_02505 [Deltaproteobacteria bacterium]|nr:hypothetical protein [Deltaproteobacteria bacterium]